MCWSTANGLLLSGYCCLYVSNATFMDVKGYEPGLTVKKREVFKSRCCIFKISSLKKAFNPMGRYEKEGENILKILIYLFA